MFSVLGETFLRRTLAEGAMDDTPEISSVRAAVNFMIDFIFLK
jgi:hypothetical protein